MGAVGLGALARRTRLRACQVAAVVAVASFVSAGSKAQAADGSAPAQAPSGDAINQALLKKIEALEQRIKSLEARDKQQSTAADTTGSVKPQPKSGKRDDSPAASTDPATSQAQNKSGKANTASTPDKTTADGKAAKQAADGKATKPADDGKTTKQADDTKTAKLTEDKPILGIMDSPVAGLSIGAYGEVYFGALQNPSAGGQWQNGFDARRVVLLPTYAITDNIIFNAEIEFEHAGSGFDNDDKLHGTAEIEQLWIDFKIIDQFNWRAPGIDLVPIGYINQHHEPTQFYSVERPELYNGLIPSTWKVPGSSVYGTINEDLKYQVMVSTSNEDFGDSFDNRTEARTVPLPGTPYFPGIDGLNALTFSNPPLGGFQQLSDTMAVSGRLDITPTFLPG